MDISVETFVEPLAFIDTHFGELWVCETCYLGALPASLTPDQVQSLHAEFAIQYRDRRQFMDAICAGERALKLGLSADILAELAYVHFKLGQQSEAADFYRQALDLKTNHFMATGNLRRLVDPATNS